MVLTMTMRGTVIARHVREQLGGAGYPLLKAEMLNRVAYPEAGIEGLSPSITDPDGAAARDIAAIAQELMKLENHEFMKEARGMTSKKLGALLRSAPPATARAEAPELALPAARPEPFAELERPERAVTKPPAPEAEVPLQVLIPEHIRRQLAVKAAEEGRSLRSLVLTRAPWAGDRRKRGRHQGEARSAEFMNY